MTDISEWKSHKDLKYTNLPSQRGVNILKIARFGVMQFREGTGRDAVDRDCRVAYCDGYRLPLKLTNTRLEAIAAVLKERDPMKWIGKKIGVFVGPSKYSGKKGIDIFVYARPVDQTVPHSTERDPSPAGEEPHEIPEDDGPEPAQPETAEQPPEPKQPEEPPPGPIGKENAALVLYTLGVRGKTWTDLLAYLKRCGADNGCHGVLPFECPGAMLPWARQFCTSFPKVKDLGNKDDFVRKTIAGWEPPPAPAGTASSTTPAKPKEHIDPKTGEVMLTEPRDDIPF